MAWNTSDFVDRLGNLFGYANDVGVAVDTLYNTSLTSVMTMFGSTDDRPAVSNLSVLGIAETGLPNNIGVYLYQQIAGSVEDFIIEYVRRETSVFDGTIETALREVNKQLVAASDTFMWVGTSTISTSLSTSTNQGNGSLIARQNRPASTLAKQELFSETINVRCTQGGNVGNFGQGTFELVGVSALPNVNTKWSTGGSGTRINITATTASVTSTIGTSGVSLLANGDFESWNGNTPLAWDIVTGAAGTQIFQVS